MGCGLSVTKRQETEFRWYDVGLQNGYISDRSQPLWIVKPVNIKYTHWDFLLMDDVADAEDGIVYGLTSGKRDDIRIPSQSSTPAKYSKKSGTGKYHAAVDVDVRQDRSRKWYDDHKHVYFRIKGAVSTPDRIKKATELVINGFKYTLLTQNCQAFAVEVLKVLHQWDPAMVPRSAIDHCRTECMKSVAWATRDNRPGPLSSKHPQRPHFSSAMSPSASSTFIPVVSNNHLPLEETVDPSTLPKTSPAVSKTSLPVEETVNSSKSSSTSGSLSEYSSTASSTKMPGSWEWVEEEE
ncbi:hypothetical protein DM02DRAFT_648678 [Periconia macrospinosa]|uniref:Uncharacterized protein n=1 Tax=Periconia macrospinosa TaxID=97972 RepID=A0A2V1EE20_9PLEO|nr:hypothetical protein DM02DRAFT_648678 [Periconia macrospinosa]